MPTELIQLSLGPIPAKDHRRITKAASLSGKSRRAWCLELLVAKAKDVIVEAIDEDGR